MFKQFKRSYSSLLRKAAGRRLYLLWIGVAIILISILALARSASAPINNSNNPQIDLLNGQDWSHMAGAQKNGQGVHITPLGRAIVNQDGSGGQANPPVNVRGPHLNTAGDFTVTADVSGIPAEGPAALTLYGQVPIIYDEWRFQTPQLQLDVYKDKLGVKEWNGASDTASFQRIWQTNSSQKTAIKLSVQGANIYLWRDNSLIGKIPNTQLFKSGQVWFGADAPIGSAGWDLTSLKAQSLGRTVSVIPAVPLKVPKSRDSLSTLSSKGNRQLPIGAAVANYALFSDPNYRQLAGSQINILVPENELKAQFVHPQPDVYSFTDADNLVDFALANNMAVHGHNLVFSEANPRWMQTSPISQRRDIMTSHINAVVTHYSGQINEWDVVDEPLNDNDDNNGNSSDLRNNIWFQAMGEQYIDTAFMSARAANPNAKLYLNEYGLEADGPRWDEFLSLVSRLQSRGVPVDGIGFQGHVHERADLIDGSILRSHIQILAQMGLASRISEMDVYGDDSQQQSQQYSVVLKACLVENSCTAFTMWGLTDRYGSTTDIHNYPLNYGNDLVWDERFRAKSAFNSLQNALKG